MIGTQLPTRSLACLLAGLLSLLGGCRKPMPVDAVAEVQPSVRVVAAWPAIVVDGPPGSFSVPWAPRPGAQLELWQIDLLDIDRPDLSAWLEAWRPGAEAMSRRVPLASEAAADALSVTRPGAYVVRSLGGGEVRVALAIASHLRAHLSLEDDEAEVLCAHSVTGKPVTGAFVQVVYRTERLGREQVLSASGTTDADGRWHSSIVRDRFAARIEAIAVASHGRDQALVAGNRTLDHSDAQHRVTLRARKSVFRPSEAAELTGALQARAGHGVAPSGNAAVKLWLLGPSGAVADTARVRTDVVGVFTSTFQLPKDAQPGRYAVVMTVDGMPGFEPRRFDAFSVAVPRAEPFRAALSLSRTVLTPGESLEITAEARQADGAPIAGARVRLLSWGYPVALEGAPAWANEVEPIDPERLVVLPANIPAAVETDASGKAVVRWQPTGAELPHRDLLCAVSAELALPGASGASVERMAEFVLLRQLPPVGLEADKAFARPSEPIELHFTSPLPPTEQAAPRASCRLAFEDRQGERHEYALLEAPIAWLAQQRLVVRATQPGRLAFDVSAGGARADAVVWVLDGEGNLAWRGATRPELILERPWLRCGEALHAVIAAPGREAPVALTLHSAGRTTRRNLALTTGAWALELCAAPGDADPLEATLVQFSGGQFAASKTSVGVEPGGRLLDVQPRLLWVRHGEWSGRGYGIATRDRLGEGVQTIVHLVLARPTFQGGPPTGIRRRTLHWHPGKATSTKGEIEVGFSDALLGDAGALLIEALAPDGRSGLRLMPIHTPGYTLGIPAGQARQPLDLLKSLAAHGLGAPMARWLASHLIAQHRGLAAELPGLAARAASAEEANAILRMAMAYPTVAPGAFEAALARDGTARPEALAIAAERVSDLRSAFERVLASDASPPARTAAARALGRALPASLPGLVQALEAEKDPLVRAAVAAALAQGGPDAVPALAKAAQSDATTAPRLAAIDALGQVGGEAAAACLLNLVADGADEMALAALRALEAIGYRGTDPRLLRVLNSATSAGRTEAARLLAKGGAPEAVEAVLAAAKAAPTGELVDVLRPFRTRDVQTAMAGWLQHSDPAVRLAAAEYMASIKDERAPAVLRGLLEADVPAAVADRAAASLIALRDVAAVPRLLALLDAGRLTPPTRRALVQAAGRLGWQQAGAAIVAILWRGVADPAALSQAEERQLWIDAVEAAATVGPVWSAVVESAVGPMPAESPYEAALTALRVEGVAGFLAALWRSPLPDDVRRHTVVPYARLRGAAAAPRLIELLESPVLQGPAIRALADVGAADALIAALRHPSVVTRAAAAAALGATGEPRAVPALEPLLHDDDPFVRAEAAWALATLTRRPVVYTDHLGEPRRAVAPNQAQ